MRAYYSGTIKSFLDRKDTDILGDLTRISPFPVELKQKKAWKSQIHILKNSIQEFEKGHIYFEYSIPRIGKRVDVILLLNGIVQVLEFKVGSKGYKTADIDQVVDYALDLKYFHERSWDLSIIPILIATKADDITPRWYPSDDYVYSPILANMHNLSNILQSSFRNVPSKNIDPYLWEESSYKPTPTIIEATKALYANHNVKEISRSEGGAINLSTTTEAVTRCIEDAKKGQKKIICFVTGVPGSGKTLAGLNIASERLYKGRDEHAVILSGNGPLVKVLREALIRDRMSRVRASKSRKRVRDETSKRVIALIQNIYHYRENAIDTKQTLLEKVIIFDEAQRAWTEKQLSAFMKDKYGIADFNQSEPAFLIGVMDRFSDWAVIVCLVGGGQEINTGEAGLVEWFRALKSRYPKWQIAISPNLIDKEYLGGMKIESYNMEDRICLNPALHLAVSNRSFRSEDVSSLVKHILDNHYVEAVVIYTKVKKNYPIVLTRDLETAKMWIRSHARGTERYGILASSGASRLRPLGLNIKSKIEVTNWFLNEKTDVRSSYYLEEAATEFDIQGLELDWTVVAWEADLRYATNEWKSKNFIGTRWQDVKSEEKQHYLLNAYRVLLTRARQGMVIFVPRGDPDDPTRLPEFYDGTYDYLTSIGLEVLK